MFKIIVPLDDTYSYDIGNTKGQKSTELKGKNYPLNCTLTEKAILEYLAEFPTATQKIIAEAIGKSVKTVKNHMSVLQKKGLLKREGTKRNGLWVVVCDGHYVEGLDKPEYLICERRIKNDEDYD